MSALPAMTPAFPAKARRRFSRMIVLSLPGILILLTTFGAAQNRQDDSVIRFGLTLSVVEPDVNTVDALAAAKIWAAAMGKGAGLWTTSDGAVYSDPETLKAAVDRGETDVLALGTHEYLEIKDSLKAAPAFAYLQGGQYENQYLILVHRDSNFKTVGDLRNQRIAFTRAGRNSMVPLWLEVLLYENGIKEQRKFFREMKEVQKPSQAILPIFFRQIESGIVLKSSFETAVALNPQLGQQIRILASSPKLVLMMICLRSTLSDGQIDQYTRQALRLHETPSGLQSFALFKIDRLIPWNPSYLDNVKELMRKRKLFRSGADLQLRANVPGEAGKQK